MTVTTLCDIPCLLGEGPSFDPHTSTLWWFDIVRARLVEMPLDGQGASLGRVTFHDLPAMGSAIARIDGERQAIATADGLYERDARGGRMTLIQPIEQDNAATRSNDARVHPSGAFWIGTMAVDESAPAARGAGAIYWWRKGELRRLYERITIPNAICFSPDGATAYFTDTADNRLMRVACDPATGLPTGEPSVLLDQRAANRAGERGFLDGAVCDGEGRIWNTRWGGGTLDCISPAGARLRSIPIPAGQSSCPAFIPGGFAVTSAAKGLSPEQLAADAKAGWTFRVTMEVAARAEPDLAL